MKTRSREPEELAEVPHVLMKGDVFSNDLIDAWIAYKREAEADHVRLRPVPAELQPYDDC